MVPLLGPPKRLEVAGLRPTKSEAPASELAGCCGCDGANRLGVEVAPPRFEESDGCLGGCDAPLVPNILIEGVEEDCGWELFGLPNSEVVDPACDCAEVVGAPKREEVELG